MDEITRAVRDMYEAYPYPAGAPMLRSSSDVRAVLSHVSKARATAGQLRALDAGCGRGVGLLGHATLQPDVEFVGIDINRRALAEAAQAAQARKLSNVRFEEVDLMTLEGLEAPAGGFDVIYSSGVLHHLSDPLTGLRKLTEHLAPHGVLVVMVYGKQGREPLYRLARAIAAAVASSAPYAERIGVGRRIAAQMEPMLTGTPWQGSADVDDVEFVDRFLNVHETSYDVPQLWQLLDQADLHFIRWCEPDDWSLDALGCDVSSDGLTPLAEYRLIEQMHWRPTLELLVAHRDNPPRAPIDGDAIDAEHFAVNPEVRISVETRGVRGAKRIEGLSYKVRSGEPVAVSEPAHVAALLILSDQDMPFSGGSFVSVMAQDGVGGASARRVLQELVARDVVYRPHATDL